MNIKIISLEKLGNKKIKFKLRVTVLGVTGLEGNCPEGNCPYQFKLGVTVLAPGLKYCKAHSQPIEISVINKRGVQP